MRLYSRNVLLIACAALAACGSAPLRFYTLVAPAAAPAAAAPGYSIEVLPVNVPLQVDQPQLVLRRGTGQVALAEDRQWIAPLPDELRAALSAELSRRLGAADVYRVTQPEGSKVWRIKLDVRRFESELNRSARIEALWTLQSPVDKAVPLVCASSVDERVGAGYASLVEGHQRALGRIAQSIAAVIAGGSLRCPDQPLTQTP